MQAVHAVDAAAPVAEVNEPAEHWVQLPAPVAVAYAPAAQGAHTLAPKSELAPAAHGTQLVESPAPTTVEYDPAAQPAHTSPPSRKVPAGHDDVHTDAPAAERNPAPQLVHAPGDDAPVVPRYSPAVHTWQLTAPLPLWYAPEGQLMQLVALDAPGASRYSP